MSSPPELESGLAAREGFWLTLAAALMGAAVYAIASGQFGKVGDILWSEEGAGWVSALATIGATVVALKLGLEAVRRQENDQERRRKAVAFLILKRVSKATITLKIISDSTYRDNPAQASTVWVDRVTDEIENIPELVNEEWAQLVLELGADANHLLTLADVSIYGAKRALPPRNGVLIERVTDIFGCVDRCFEVVKRASDAVYDECYGHGGPRPWHGNSSAN